ncbi:MAG: hypothetical protein Kow00124_08760 [Anaerolineae bacterium]
MPPQAHFLTAHVGSVPHTESRAICDLLVEQLDLPAWPQHPRRTFRENMYVQYSLRLPGAVVDDTQERIYFDTGPDLIPALEAFYEHYLADDVAWFGLTPDYARGFFAMLEALPAGDGWAKGQVTGPISLGLTVTDQGLRSILYHPDLADAVVKNAAMNARWQVQQLKQRRSDIVIFVDEPYMASFGSAFISLERAQAITMLDEVFSAIHQEGALAGVHCCANTDWSVLLATQVDILNLDSFGFVENLALYPDELRAFLDRGGWIAWGSIPNNEGITEHTPEALARRLHEGMRLIAGRAARRGVAIDVSELATRSLLTPSCGLGSTTVDTAEQVLRALKPTAEMLRQSVG